MVLSAFAPQSLNATPAARRVTIGGAGSVYLRYPDAQATLKLRPGDTLYIAAGTYSGISLGNMSGSPARPITVRCDPNALFTSTKSLSNDFPNIAHVRFEDFRFKTYKTACMKVTGRSHDLLFRNFTITDASGYCFYVYDSGKVFDGTKDSTFYNFKWENVVVDGKVNGSAITNSDYRSPSNLKSVLLDFEIYRCTFKHFDNSKGAFSAIAFDKCFNLHVHECNFSDIGMAKSPIGHNVCIVGSGYFKVYRNRFTRHWANDVRVWPMKLNALGYNGPDAVNRYYNNISWEKRKYPAFEHNRVRQADIDKSSGYLSRTGSEIFFNTLYRSRKATSSSDPYCAQLVDVYGPNVTIKHNLIIQPAADSPFDPNTNYVYHLGSGRQEGIVAENNLVFRTLAASRLVDAVRFSPSQKSPAADAAAGRVEYVTTDHYGHNRYVGKAADVGAVERQQDAKRLPGSGGSQCVQ